MSYFSMRRPVPFYLMSNLEALKLRQIKPLLRCFDCSGGKLEYYKALIYEQLVLWWPFSRVCTQLSLQRNAVTHWSWASLYMLCEIVLHRVSQWGTRQTSLVQRAMALGGPYGVRWLVGWFSGWFVGRVPEQLLQLQGSTSVAPPLCDYTEGWSEISR